MSLVRRYDVIPDLDHSALIRWRLESHAANHDVVSLVYDDAAPHTTVRIRSQLGYFGRKHEITHRLIREIIWYVDPKQFLKV